MRRVLAVPVALIALAGPAGAQPPAALSPTDARTVQAYALTASALRKVEAAGRAYQRAAKADAAFGGRVSAVRELAVLNARPEPSDAEVERMTLLERQLARDPVRLDRLYNGGSIEVVSGRLARVAPLATALKAAGLAPAEFVTFQRAVAQAMWEAERRATGVGGSPAATTPANVAWVTRNRVALARARTAWLPFWE